jgi:hypothetical protein
MLHCLKIPHAGRHHMLGNSHGSFHSFKYFQPNKKYAPLSHGKSLDNAHNKRPWRRLVQMATHRARATTQHVRYSRVPLYDHGYESDDDGDDYSNYNARVIYNNSIVEGEVSQYNFAVVGIASHDEISKVKARPVNDCSRPSKHIAAASPSTSWTSKVLPKRLVHHLSTTTPTKSKAKSTTKTYVPHGYSPTLTDPVSPFESVSLTEASESTSSRSYLDWSFPSDEGDLQVKDRSFSRPTNLTFGDVSMIEQSFSMAHDISHINMSNPLLPSAPMRNVLYCYSDKCSVCRRPSPPIFVRANPMSKRELYALADKNKWRRTKSNRKHDETTILFSNLDKVSLPFGKNEHKVVNSAQKTANNAKTNKKANKGDKKKSKGDKQTSKADEFMDLVVTCVSDLWEHPGSFNMCSHPNLRQAIIVEKDGKTKRKSTLVYV